MRRLFGRIRRLIEYAPVLWVNADWDYYWIFHLLEYKLGRVEKALREDPFHVGAADRADQVKRARLAIKRLMKDDYADTSVLDEIYGPYGKGLKRTNIRTKEDEAKYHRDLHRIMQHEEAQRKQDWEYFVRIFGKHYRGWWI